MLVLQLHFALLQECALGLCTFAKGTFWVILFFVAYAFTHKALYDVFFFQPRCFPHAWMLAWMHAIEVAGFCVILYYILSQIVLAYLFFHT